MWLYESPIRLAAAAGITLLLLIWLGAGQSPVAIVRKAFDGFRKDPRSVYIIAGILSVLAINTLQLRWEEQVAVSADYTAEAAQFGARLIVALQGLESAPLTHALTFAYVILFPLLGLASLLIYGARRDWGALRGLTLGYVANYAVALPFYLYVPVKEAWAGEAGVRFLIPQVYAGFEAQYRAFSGLDNCFPSLHTSLALTFALVAWRHGYRQLGWVLSVFAATVALSTLYLGVHWIADLIAGACLAVAAAGCIRLPLTGAAHEEVMAGGD